MFLDFLIVLHEDAKSIGFLIGAIFDVVLGFPVLEKSFLIKLWQNTNEP